MPKLKRSKEDLANGRLLEAIAGSAAFYFLSPDELAMTARVSRSSWYRRLRKPGTFTLDEFRRLAWKFKWDDAVILQIVRWQA